MIDLALGPEHRDIITTGGTIVVALITAIGAAGIELIRRGNKVSRRAAARAGDAASLAGQAVEQTKATGNGHAKRVENALADILATQREQAKDIGGLREELRDERRERQLLTEYIIRRDAHQEAQP